MKLFSIPALLALLITIVLPDGSSYDVTATQVNAATWAYHIDRTAGKDLSHWVLSLGICDEAVVTTQPPATYGADPTTGVTGWKFEPITDQSATYTITLDTEYPTGVVTVTLKAGALGNQVSGTVAGPDCGEAPVATPTPTATATEPATVTPTATATAGSTSSPTATATATATPTPTVTSAGSVTPTATATPTPTATEPAAVAPTATATPPTSTDPTGIKDGNEPARWWHWLPWVGR